ncbi:MAG: LUD domain-containing protein [Bacteroidales bacterium]|nr:LUD domain-containing protein [Bacteroidales bacterium]
MKESTSKEKVLKAIRNAQAEADYPKKTMDVDTRTSIYPPIEGSPDIYFAHRLEDNRGRFIYCENMHEAMFNLQHIVAENKYDAIYTNEPDIENFLKESSINFVNYEQGLKKAQAAITLCECLVARFGTIVMSSRQLTGRKAHTLPEAHIVIAFKGQVISEITSAFQFLQNKYGRSMPSMITFITGPSRTDAIQGERVYGVNGAKELYVLYIDI